MNEYEKIEAEKNAIDTTDYSNYIKKENKLKISFKTICIFLLIIIIILILYFNNIFYKLTFVTENNINDILISEKLSENEKIKIYFKIYNDEEIYNKFLFQIIK